MVNESSGARCPVCEPLVSPPASCPTGVLRESYEKGCPTCMLLWNALSQKLDLGNPIIERVESIGGYDFFSLAAGSAKHRPTTGSLWDYVSVTLAVDGGDATCHSELEWLPVLRKSPLSRTKDRDIKLTRDRLKECQRNHTGCPRFDDEALPTRVIDVGICGQEPFLYVSQGQKGRYLALSHRWGDPKSSHRKLLTLKGNLDTHRKGIPLAEFPKTFREAIEVARGLEIRYIWIDSLCIVQDDKADWEVEAGRMADVYSNAFATIFAERARHSDDGLFQSEADRAALRSVRSIPYVGTISGRTSRVLVQTQVDSNTANFATDVTELFCQAEQSASQLAGRGWILQEEVLSRRRIHFTDTELKWKCPSAANCDCGLPTPPDMGDPGTNFSILETPEKGRAQLWKTPAWLWQQLVEHYTSRDLTFETDRLVALAGMASKIPRLPGDYIAGLWRDHLNTGILWKASGSPARCSRPAEYVAPSWSWASVSGKIRFVPLSADTRFTWRVLDAQCAPKGKNSAFGQLAEGYLRVGGAAARVDVEERPQDMRMEIARERWDSGDATWRPRDGGVRYLTVVPARQTPDVPAPESTVLELDVQSDWDELLAGRYEFRILCVALVDTFWEYRPAKRALCLLLRSSPRRSGCWERVCYVFPRGTWDSWVPYVADEEMIIL
ncbi:hypothetical protein AAE478_005669 [Parahypoxylon ruwenzoriense]